MARTSKKSVSRPRDEDAKSDRKPKSVQVANPALPLNPESDASEADESTDDDDENSGVDDEGLEKLLKALGEDGLDEFDLAQLRMLSGALAGEESEDDANAESVPEDEGPGDGEEEEEEEEEKEKKSHWTTMMSILSTKTRFHGGKSKWTTRCVLSRSSFAISAYIMARSRSSADGIPSNWTHHFHGQRR